MDSAERHLAQLAAEASYRRQRLALYRARLYAGRASDRARLAELERGAEQAQARLRRAGAGRPADGRSARLRRQ